MAVLAIGARGGLGEYMATNGGGYASDVTGAWSRTLRALNL
ncbi:MAG: hypothetical protein QOI30_2769 [Mycobacterium sp.]|jgi:hypothetical protein|nr:hypothetical protein [Mycobacterium sp.]MDT7769759.1 hypothetical protein [Mycobacterium sp.]